MLYMVLLAPASRARLDTCMHMPNTVTHLLAQVISHGEYSVDILFYAVK
jgi:hypothetical protein